MMVDFALLCMVAILIVSHCVLLNRKYSFIYIYIITGESLLSACIVALETERLQYIVTAEWQ